MVYRNTTSTGASQGNAFVDNLRRVVGVSYILADSAYGTRSYILAKGYKKEMKHYAKDSKRYKELDEARKGEQKEIVGMGLWAAGGITMALFGNRSTEKEMRALSNKLAGFLKEEGVDLKGDALAKAIEDKDKGLFDKILDFAYRYPSEIMHTCFVAGSVGLIAHGMGKKGKNGGPDKKTDLFTVGQGLAVLIGALIGVFVPEKTPEQIAKMPPATNSLQKAGRFIQLHANKFTSGFYLSNNAFSAVRMMNDKKKFAIDEWSKKNTDEQSKAFHNVWQIRGGALAAYLFGAGTLAATKKSGGGGEKGRHEKDTILQEAAEMLASMPDEIRNTYIQKTATYLSQRRELGFSQMDSSEIAEKITEALKNQTKRANNWVEKSSQVPEGNGKIV